MINNSHMKKALKIITQVKGMHINKFTRNT
jgi:hypothetical protein